MGSRFLAGGGSADLAALQNGTFQLNVGSIVDQDLVSDGVLRSEGRKIGVGLVTEADLSFVALTDPFAAKLRVRDLETAYDTTPVSLNEFIANAINITDSLDIRADALEDLTQHMSVAAGNKTVFAGPVATTTLQAADLSSAIVELGGDGVEVLASSFAFNGSVVATVDDIPTLSLSSAGGSSSLVVDGVGPAFSVRGVTAGTGITVTQNANDISINNTDRGSAVTLASAGGTETLVNDGVGPALATKGLSAGTGGISLTGATGSVTIDNTLTGASLGGAAVFANKTGATLNLRGVTAGTGITVTQNANDITLTNADRGSAVTLASAGGTETLVNDGVGPALATKGLSAGTGGISLTGATGSVTIDNTLTGASLGGAAVFANKTGATLNLRGVTAGTGITVTQNANDITLTNAMTIASAGGDSLIASATLPDIRLNGLSAGSGITIGAATGGAIPISVSARSYGSAFFNGNGSVTTVSGTYGPINATYNIGLVQGFTHAGGILTYTGATTRVFLVSFHGSVKTQTANATPIFAIFRNGALMGGFHSLFMNTTNQPYAFGMSYYASLATNGTVEIRVMSNPASNLVVFTMYVTVSQVD